MASHGILGISLLPKIKYIKFQNGMSQSLPMIATYLRPCMGKNSFQEHSWALFNLQRHTSKPLSSS